MVYRGKPSPGCAQCRARRLKCDRRQPSCSQCIRAKKECTGYQDLNALRFYDQTDEVTSKAKTQIARRAGSGSRSPPNRRSPTPTFEMPLNFTPSFLDDQAISHTIKYFVGEDNHHGALLFLHLPEILTKDASDALQITMKAIGLACMAGIHNHPFLRRSAQEAYVMALQATNKRLQDVASAKKDSTLATVMMLSVYETVTCRQHNLMGPWLNHIQGAIRLLELRDVDNLATPMGMDMFRIVRQALALSNVFFRTNVHKSPGLVALMKAARQYCAPEALPIEDFYDLVIVLNDLSYTMEEAYNDNQYSGDTTPLMTQCLQLDAAMAAWEAGLGPGWRYELIFGKPPMTEARVPFATLDDEYHMYPRLPVATIWSYYRQARIVLNEMILTLFWAKPQSWDDPEAQRIMHHATAVNQQLVKEVCDSVAYFFISSEIVFGSLTRQLWPFLIAADSTSAQPRQKVYLQQTLELIARCTGIKQADFLANIIKRGRATPLVPGRAHFLQGKQATIPLWDPDYDEFTESMDV